jgi:hypothetical protein
MSVGELVTATMQAYLKKAPSLIAHLLDFVTCSQPTLRGPSAPSFLLAGTVESNRVLLLLHVLLQVGLRGNGLKPRQSFAGLKFVFGLLLYAEGTSSDMLVLGLRVPGPLFAQSSGSCSLLASPLVPLMFGLSMPSSK